MRRQVEKASSPITNEMTPAEVDAELQHRRSVRAAAVEQEPPSSVPDGTDDDVDPAPSATASPSGGRPGSGVHIPDVGGGLVLGAFAYVLGLTYLRGGKAEVKALLKAKFLNQVGSAS